MQKRLIIGFAVLLVTGIVLSSPIVAEEGEFAKVEFATGEYPPYMSENLEGKGVVSKVITEACRRAGIEANIQFYPWARVFGMTETGHFPASFFWLITEERLGKVAYGAQHVSEGPAAVFYKKSKFPEGITFSSYEDLKNLKVVGVRSFWYEADFKKIGKTDVHYVSAEDLAIKVLINDRADVYVSDMLTGIHLTKQVLGNQASELGYSKLRKEPDKGYIVYP